ncbi:MAG: glutathione synthase [Gammaproteobacteria bacterium]
MSSLFRLGIIIDPIETLNPFKDSTVGMIRAAKARQWDVSLFDLNALRATEQGLHSKGIRVQSLNEHRLETKPTHHQASTPDWLEAESIDMNLAELDLMLMRKDPPYSTTYHFTCQLLSQLERHGVLVSNSPQSLRDCNEKLFALQFPDCTTPTLVSSHLSDFASFAIEHGTIIIKPLDGMGGQGIFKVDEQQTNLPVIVEMLSQSGQFPIMAQRYLPAIQHGDKRVLMINGEAIPYLLARIPQQGDIRGNLAAGGKGVVQALTQTEQAICDRVGPVLRNKGIHFAGLDIIGDRLTEINITSPTCIREIERETQLDIAGALLDHLFTQCNRADSR